MFGIKIHFCDLLIGHNSCRKLRERRKKRKRFFLGLACCGMSEASFHTLQDAESSLKFNSWAVCLFILVPNFIYVVLAGNYMTSFAVTLCDESRNYIDTNSDGHSSFVGNHWVCRGAWVAFSVVVVPSALSFMIYSMFLWAEPTLLLSFSSSLPTSLFLEKGSAKEIAETHKAEWNKSGRDEDLLIWASLTHTGWFNWSLLWALFPWYIIFESLLSCCVTVPSFLTFSCRVSFPPIKIPPSESDTEPLLSPV